MSMGLKWWKTHWGANEEMLLAVGRDNFWQKLQGPALQLSPKHGDDDDWWLGWWWWWWVGWCWSWWWRWWQSSIGFCPQFWQWQGLTQAANTLLHCQWFILALGIYIYVAPLGNYVYSWFLFMMYSKKLYFFAGFWIYIYCRLSWNLYLLQVLIIYSSSWNLCLLKV